MALKKKKRKTTAEEGTAAEFAAAAPLSKKKKKRKIAVEGTAAEPSAAAASAKRRKMAGSSARILESGMSPKAPPVGVQGEALAEKKKKKKKLKKPEPPAADGAAVKKVKKKKTKKAKAAAAAAGSDDAKATVATKKGSEKKGDPRGVAAEAKAMKKMTAKERFEAAAAAASSDEDSSESSKCSFFAGEKEKPADLVDPRKVSDEFKVFVGGFSWDVPEETVRKALAGFGEVLRFDMPKGKGVAFVYYKDKAAMEKALELDGTSFHGRVIKVKRAAKKGERATEDKKSQGSDKRDAIKAERAVKDELTVFVGSLAFDSDLEALERDFAECGEIESIRTLKQPDGSFKGTAFIVYKTKEAVEAALKFHQTSYGGRYINVRMAANTKGKGKDGKGKADGKGRGGGRGAGSLTQGNAATWNNDHDRTVFVGFLHRDTQEAELRKDFEECGEVEKLRMLNDSEGKFKGAAFIVFKSVDAVASALEYDGQNYNGRTLKVSMAGDKPQKDAGGKGKGKGRGRG